MLDKNTINAYHKITAPEGLQERIEAKAREEQAARAGKASGSRRKIWGPAAAAFAAAAICLAVLAGRSAVFPENTGSQAGGARMADFDGVILITDGGEALGSSAVALGGFGGYPANDIALTQEMPEGESIQEDEAAADYDFEKYGENSEQDQLTARSEAKEVEEAQTAASESAEEEPAVLFHVVTSQQVTFKTSGNYLSTYDATSLRWTDRCDELVLETEGELCVFLPFMGDKEVLYIEMSSDADSGRIEIAYDEANGCYMAVCRTITGE